MNKNKIFTLLLEQLPLLQRKPDAYQILDMYMDDELVKDYML